MPRKVLATLLMSILVAACSTLPVPSGEGAEMAVVIEARQPTTIEEVVRDLGSGTTTIPRRM